MREGDNLILSSSELVKVSTTEWESSASSRSPQLRLFFHSVLFFFCIFDFNIVLFLDNSLWFLLKTHFSWQREPFFFVLPLPRLLLLLCIMYRWDGWILRSWAEEWASPLNYIFVYPIRAVELKEALFFPLRFSSFFVQGWTFHRQIFCFPLNFSCAKKIDFPLYAPLLLFDTYCKFHTLTHSLLPSRFRRRYCFRATRWYRNEIKLDMFEMRRIENPFDCQCWWL